MTSMLSILFATSGRGTRRRKFRPAGLQLGGEALEPRLAMAATLGTQAFLALGDTTASPSGNINTATTFTLNNVVCTGAQTGWFQTIAVAPGSSAGTWTIDTNNPASLTFTHPKFGTFQSTSITTESNTVVPGQQRTFYVLGTLSGTLANPVVPSPAPASLTIGLTQTGAAISSSATLSLPPPPPKSPVLVAANDLGCESTPLVYVINPYTGAVTDSFNPYPDYVGFRGGVRVAVGNVDNDPTTLEIVTAPGPGRVGQVRVFSLDGVEKPGFRYLPFGSGYVRGVEVAVGDIDGDGIDDLVAGASRGPGSVNVTRSTGITFVSQPSKSFTAFGGTYTGGATVAVGAVGEIVVGSGVGLPPTVKTYNVSGATPTVIGQLAPRVPTGTNGVTVTTQQFTAGAKPEIMVAGGRDANSAIGVYKGDVNPPTNTYTTFASQPKPNAPVYAAAAALASAFADTIFMAQGDGGVGTILKVSAATGLVDPTFTPTIGGKPIISPLRIATRVAR